MKTTFLVFLLLLIVSTAFAQNKQFDIVVGGGYYATPSRVPVFGGEFFNGEFEYHHNRRWAFSAGLLTTQYHYRLDGSRSSTLSGIPINRGGEIQTNFMAKYKVVNQKVLTVQLGLGAGLFTMGQEVAIDYSNGSSSYLYTSNTDLGFPLSAEAYTPLTRHILIGVKVGSFIFPDYPIVGNNVSFQVRYRL
ncbi:hypothetical protein [Telluribacter sp.]|jgi:hypothetical protein|uniref:hypothetical protein n=1 Tax=Telluribacter sp. TaxID=1978767 RepID=UPI002E125F6C|nr:hypothetical protein [Telluribacter sp.]